MWVLRVPIVAALITVAGCGGTTGPTCDPTIIINAQGSYDILGASPGVFFGQDGIKQSVVGAETFAYLVDVLVSGQPTGAGSVVWRVVIPAFTPLVLTYQMSRIEPAVTLLSVEGEPNAPVGRGPSLTPSNTVRFVMETGLGRFVATDGTFEIMAAGPLRGTLMADLLANTGFSGNVRSEVTINHQPCLLSP